MDNWHNVNFSKNPGEVAAPSPPPEFYWTAIQITAALVPSAI